MTGALPLFWLLNHPSELLAQLGQLGLALLMGLYYGALPAILVEAAPPSVRCTAVALGYNLCYGLFGGLSPLAAVTFVTVFWFRETYRSSFAAVPSTAAA